MAIYATMLGTLIWYGSVVLWTARHGNPIDREYRRHGMDGRDEEPIPVRWAESRESLVVSLVMLSIIAGVFVAYFSGWLSRAR